MVMPPSQTVESTDHKKQVFNHWNYDTRSDQVEEEEGEASQTARSEVRVQTRAFRGLRAGCVEDRNSV